MSYERRAYESVDDRSLLPRYYLLWNRLINEFIIYAWLA